MIVVANILELDQSLRINPNNYQRNRYRKPQGWVRSQKSSLMELIFSPPPQLSHFWSIQKE